MRDNDLFMSEKGISSKKRFEPSLVAAQREVDTEHLKQP